jgi:iron complex outermembrane recepter protein
MRLERLLLASVTAGLLLPAAPALAQQFADTDTAEIIVTARKRQESILAVPVVETVLSGALLERVQVKDLFDVAKRTTGLLLGQSTVDIGTQISLRGVGSTSFDPGVDQSVSLNLDGLQVTQGSAYSVGVFDMAQIEILKGSQALFFGKSSPGGVVAIRTNDPGKEFEFAGKTGYEFEAREWRNELVVSGPVTDSLGLRVAALYSDLGGYFRNSATPIAASGAAPLSKRFGETKTLFLRGTAVFKPTPALSMRLKLNYTRDRNYDAVPYQLTACPEGTTNYLPGIGIPLPSPYGANENCRGDRKLNVVGVSRAAFPGLEPGDSGRPITFITQRFGTLEVDYDLRPDLTLTSVTGYFHLRTRATLNCGFSGAAAPACFAEKLLTREEVTQEFRLASDFAGPLNFSFGGFYQDGRIKGVQRLPGNTFYGLPPLLFDGTQDVRIDSGSLFGQLRYKLMPELEIAAGARWTSEQRKSRPTTTDLFGAVTGVPGAILVGQIAQPKLDTSNWSPELTITYRPTSDLTLFASLKQAYKSGSYNIAVPVNPGEDKSFGDERVRGGEIGFKSRLLDRQLSFNLSGYYNKFTGLQVGVIIPFANGLPVFSTLNAASAKIYGIDADISYRPASVSGLELFGAINWNHARFTSFPNAPCFGGQTFAEGCNLAPSLVGTNFPNIAFTDPAVLGGQPFRYGGQDLSGSRLGRSPDWSANMGFHYEIPVGSMTLGLGADAQFSSKYLTNIGGDDTLFQKAFAKFNLSASLKGAGNRWELSFIGNNVANELSRNLCIISNYAGITVFPGEIFGGPARGPAGKDETYCTLDRGRELWTRLTLRF